jgi:hypothetical protein
MQSAMRQKRPVERVLADIAQAFQAGDGVGPVRFDHLYPDAAHVLL